MGNNNSGTMVSNTVNEGGNEFIIEIDQMLDELEPPSPEPCIYRVPMDFRKMNEEVYTPRIVSIGPFHHNNKNLEFMEQVKKRYMKKLVRRNGNSSLENCTHFVKTRETKIRDCYSERIEMDSTEFRKMVLVDSCFIIQFLIYVYTKFENFDYSLYIKPMMMNNLTLDLILLENQVPFFVLKELCSLTTSEEFSILRLALHFLNKASHLHVFEEFTKHNNERNFESVKHFTHMVLILYQPPPQEPPPPQNGILQCYYSSTDLTEAGVMFREKTRNGGLFDITLINELLEIPSFRLTDNTEIQIRNLLALELCLGQEERFLIDYFIFMNNLINTTMDVNLLVHKKIIINNLGNKNAVADFFNNLCINMPQSGNFYFSVVCEKLNKYYELPRHRVKAMLKRDYFHTPWQTASTIAAITLLILTLIQAVCSIISTVNG